MIFLLSPGQLLRDHRVLKSLHIKRSGAKIDYEAVTFNEREIKTIFITLPEPTRNLLGLFGEKGIRELKATIHHKYAARRPGSSFEKFYSQAALKELHGLFVDLRPAISQVKWYHRIRLAEKRYKTAPCQFSETKPILRLEVIKEKGRLKLLKRVEIAGPQIAASPEKATFSLEEFKRHHFLIERSDTYFLLSYRDFNALNWLEENPPERYAEDPVAFAHHVLAKLEETHSVTRNNLFDEDAIITLPENRLMLSELNNAFLLLTPQWTYDGLLLDGPFKETFEIRRGGKQYIVQRNKEAEEAFLGLLRELHSNFKNQHNGYYFLSFAEAQKKQWFLKTYHWLQEQEIELTGMDMLQHFRYSSHKAETSMELQDDDRQELALRLKVAFGKEKVSLKNLQKTLMAGQRAVLLKGNTLGILDDGWMEKYAAIIKHGNISGDQLRVPRWMALTQQEESPETGVLKPVIKEEWWKKWEHWQQKDEHLYPQPSGLQAALRPYQQKGYEWLTLLAETGAGACLADDMGLGKTLQTIAFLLKRLEQDAAARQLVVCPASLIYNWQQELKKFAPSINSLPYHGPAREASQLEEQTQRIIITSFGTLRSDAETLSTIPFDTVVIDESHHIKNPDALVTRAVNRLQAAARITLSGTPVMNNTFDLYSQLHFLVPGMFGSREFFRKQYANPIDRDRDEEKTNALRKLTAPFILRRTKEQVAPELPEKTETILWCDMGPGQREQYETIKSAIRSSIFLEIKQQGLGKSKLAIIQGITRLRQACNSPLLLPVEDQINGDSVKTEMLMDELCNDLKERKVLVFSQFSSMLRLLSEACRQRGIDHYHFDGSTPSRERMEMVNKFQDEENPVNVFLISLMAGNTGLNLTAASYVFLFDPWWNTAVQEQAIDRSHRIGQTRKVFAYKMVCRDSIEEKIIAMQQQKKKLAGDLIGEGDGFVKQLSLEDLEYLLA